MFENKTLIVLVIGVIIIIVILYYFYNEISNSKKMIETTYQKTMLIENKFGDFEKKMNHNKKHQKKPKNDTQSPVYSITYNSADFVKNDDQSVKYCDISKKEAEELLRNIEQNNKKILSDNKEYHQLLEALENNSSDLVRISSDTINHISETIKYADMPSDISDIIDPIRVNPKHLQSNVFSKINNKMGKNIRAK